MLRVRGYLTLTDMLRGTSISYEVVEGVLHFFVNYNMIVNIPKELPTMETLEIDQHTKKG